MYIHDAFHHKKDVYLKMIKKNSYNLLKICDLPDTLHILYLLIFTKDTGKYSFFIQKKTYVSEKLNLSEVR